MRSNTPLILSLALALASLTTSNPLPSSHSIQINKRSPPQHNLFNSPLSKRARTPTSSDDERNDPTYQQPEGPYSDGSSSASDRGSSPMQVDSDRSPSPQQQQLGHGPQSDSGTSRDADGETDSSADADGETDSSADADGETDSSADADGETDSSADADGETDSSADAIGSPDPEAAPQGGVGRGNGGDGRGGRGGGQGAGRGRGAANA
ncbi:hypothetical protein QBC40DRAFT_279309 [Triangularia verruculosa]|uniref:Uncharacterized protein n=1 Tax=Triangularia verruculosa TaxID=2587418 RepID=A0AAN6XLV1_9PEZI|nr:hypothetical protein QBC40DRAFT_279309 [Triangularia verruculosa]